MGWIAVISDVHADVHSLDAALQQIRDLGCDQIVCAGDLVDFGLFPEETISRDPGAPDPLRPRQPRSLGGRRR